MTSIPSSVKADVMESVSIPAGTMCLQVGKYCMILETFQVDSKSCLWQKSSLLSPASAVMVSSRSSESLTVMFSGR